MPGLLDTQLSSRMAKFTAQKNHALIQLFGAAGDTDTFIITDGTSPETYEIDNDGAGDFPGGGGAGTTIQVDCQAGGLGAPNVVTEIVAAINVGGAGGGPSALVDAYDIGGDVVLLVNKTAGTVGASAPMSLALNVAMVGYAGDHEDIVAGGNVNNFIGGHEEEVEVLVANTHTINAADVQALASAAGAQVPVSTVFLGEAPSLVSVLRRTAAGSYQSLVNVEVDIVNLAGDEYAVLLTDAGAVLTATDVITFMFLTG